MRSKIHLRYGIMISGYKHCRYILARIQSEDHPIVFLREWEDDEEKGHCTYYSLYRSSMTLAETEEILDYLKKGEKRKANAVFKRYFKVDGILCECVGTARLDDAVPDEWYDVWKEMKFLITSPRDHSGYYETEVEEMSCEI